MHYFTEHIGDTVKFTAHLTFLERGVFALMKSYACLTEAPFPADEEVLCRKLMARTTPEKKIVGDLLKEFWKLSEKGWEHPEPIQQIIDEYHASQEQKSAAGQASAKKRKERKGNGAATGVEPPLDGKATDGQREGNAAGNHFPLPNNHSPSPSVPAPLENGADTQPSFTLPDGIEFPAGFPDSPEKAVKWTRGLALPSQPPEAYVHELWFQAVGRDFRDGADVRIQRFAHWVHGRWMKEGTSWQVKRAEGGEKKEGGAVSPSVIKPDEAPKGWKAASIEVLGFEPESWDALPAPSKADVRTWLAQPVS